MKGKVICIEGNDRVGKHTQSLLLTEYIRKNGYNVKTISFPNYGTPQAKPVESYLTGEFPTLEPMEASILFALDRSVTFREMGIKSFLKDGGILVLDRYTPSNIIYQTARLFDQDEKIDISANKAFEFNSNIDNLEYHFLDLPQPDAVIYLNLDRDIHRQLIEKTDEIKGVQNDIHESDEKLLDHVSIVGIQIAQAFNWSIVECYDEKNHSLFSKEEIHQKIVNEISDKINIVPK